MGGGKGEKQPFITRIQNQYVQINNRQVSWQILWINQKRFSSIFFANQSKIEQENNLIKNIEII